MVGVGFLLSAAAEPDADIETTLVHASSAGMDDNDLRVLAILTTWLGVHSARVNTERLARAVAEHSSPRVRAYWSAVCTWLGDDKRFARIVAPIAGERIDLLAVGTEFQVNRRGEDPRFESTCLRVPAGTLRDRAKDVLAPAVLAERHRGYRNRIQMGATWRADIWTALEAEPGMPVAECARRVRCSFAAAWKAAQDFLLLEEARRTAS
ncbi:hypothetical protein Poly30_06650 [Planctomycetes bacterium Poly30]|uniref:Uncharacterized protein n=2 Tax=Saltatorellus ferox TaxID=2528018 RepID=A0A518EM47_9BACT|nr:hypothetical protein Poly30_06650 [Planctomycetes bacterium Poly30]